ncbi:hypothetical protein EIN_319300, partial [Entamoeba invadens IP1]
MFIFLLFFFKIQSCEVISVIPISYSSSSNGDTCYIIPNTSLLLITRNSSLTYNNHTTPVLQLDLSNSKTTQTFIWHHTNNSVLHIQHPTDNTYQTPIPLSNPYSSKPSTLFQSHFGSFFSFSGTSVVRITASALLTQKSKRVPATIFTFENDTIDEIQIGEVVVSVTGQITFFVGTKEKETIIGVYVFTAGSFGGESCETATLLGFPISLVDFKKNTKSGVWFKFFGKKGGNVTVETCGEESQFDTSIKVYDTCQTEKASEVIGYSDDFCGEQGSLNFVSEESDYFVLVSHGAKQLILME